MWRLCVAGPICHERALLLLTDSTDIETGTEDHCKQDEHWDQHYKRVPDLSNHLNTPPTKPDCWKTL